MELTGMNPILSPGGGRSGDQSGQDAGRPAGAGAWLLAGQLAGPLRRVAYRGGTLLRFALLAIAAAAAGCSAVSASYNNSPMLITWMADSYFDLDGEQETLLKERLGGFRQWHRTQLPDYASLLGEVRGRIKGNIEPADVAWLVAEGEKRYRGLIDKAAPEMAEMAGHLTRENVTHMERKLARNNGEFEHDFIAAAPEKRQDKRYERVLAEVERWYGSFDREQRAKIRALTDALPANYPLVLENRKRRQRELAQILRAAADKSAPQEQTAKQLRHWLGEWRSGGSPAYTEFAARYQEESFKMYAAIANLASPEQRATAERNVQRYIEDFNALAAPKS